MNDFEEKAQTFKFEPVKEEKPLVKRTGNDGYSAPRQEEIFENYIEKRPAPKKRKSNSDRALVITAIVLAVLLIITVIVAVIILKSPGKPGGEEPPVITQQENPEEEVTEPVEETEEEFLESGIVLYPESIIHNADGFSVLADMVEESQNGKFTRTGNTKIFINDETDIREDGKRLSVTALLYIIENMGDEEIVFNAQIRKEDDVAVSLSFKKSEIPVEEEEDNGVYTLYVAFYPETVKKTDDGFTAKADLMKETDGGMLSDEGTRVLAVKEGTDIRKNGEVISADELMEIVENMGGDIIIFDAQVRKKDNVVISIAFDLYE